MTINEIVKAGLACLSSNKKLQLVRGEKLFTNRVYAVRDTLPSILFGKSFVYSEIERAQATVQTDGYVIAITPSRFVESQRMLRKAGFFEVASCLEPIGFRPITANVMEETVSYYAKLCKKGEELAFTSKWVVLVGESDAEEAYYVHSWLKIPANVVPASEAGLAFSPKQRLWYGIPSIERTAAGRLFFSYGSGNRYEPMLDNYVVFSCMDEGGELTELVVVTHPSTGDSRVFDASLWIDPMGRLWMFWSQSCDQEDGKMGVWYVRVDNPDDTVENLRSQLSCATPKRICNGIKLNKPTVLSSGEWMFASLNPGCDERDYIYVSTDCGESWTERSQPVVRGCQHADEPMVLEIAPNNLKTFVRSTDGTGIRVIESRDNGYTWSADEDSGLDGPCSRFHIRRLKSGRVLLVNHYAFTGRSHLTAMLSEDDGKTFPYKMLLDARAGVSYPDAVEVDGKIYLTWDYDRGGAGEIMFASFTEEDVTSRGEIAAAKVKVIIKR